MALAVVLVVRASTAHAESSWWQVDSMPVPSVFTPGSARDEVQELTVSAEGGAFSLQRPTSLGRGLQTPPLGWNATHDEVQVGLEKLYGAGNVEVSGGPGDAQGTKPYLITFTGALSDRAVAQPQPRETLTGGRMDARVREVTPGRSDGEIVLSITNLGDAPIRTDTTPVKVTDVLPAGMTANRIVGAVGSLSVAVEPSLNCSVVSVSCSFKGTLAPYERIEMVIDVNVEPGTPEHLESEVSVTGSDDTPPVTVRRPLTVGPTQAGFGIQDYELYPASEDGSPATQAGSHPFQLTTTFNLNTTLEPVKLQGAALNYDFGEFASEVWPVAMPRGLRFNIPPGLIGNPMPIPQCTEYEFATPVQKGFFEDPQCPPDTAIGVATVVVTNVASALPMPLVVTVPLFNLVPSVGEPARFGFRPGVGAVTLDTYVRTGGDYGVVVHVDNITQYAGVSSSQVTFWGVPGDPRHDSSRGVQCLEASFGLFGYPPCTSGGEEHPSPFLILPTACSGPLHPSMEADSWVDPGVFASKEYTFQNMAGEPFGMDGCNRLSFEPSISLTPDGQAGSTPTGLTVGIHVPQTASLSASGDADSTVRDTTVALPAGVTLNPAAADGLSACSLEEIGLESRSEQSCPDASKIGTLEIHTPLLPHPLVGEAFLARQSENPFGSLIAMYLVAKDPYSGVLIKLAGEVKPDAVTGQLTATFKDTPPLPFEDLALHFFGGSRAPLGTPGLCGSYTTNASIVPWSGNAPVDSSSTFKVISGPNGEPCSDPLPFSPELTTGSLNLQAGAFTPFTMTMSRQDGNQNLDAIRLQMPSGLLGELSKVKLCGETEANTGTCGPESLIGETIVSVGLGSTPFTVTGGKVYITGPYAGAPYGLSIVNPAKAGPFDLGNVIVRAKIEVNPTTAAITITSDTTGPYRIPTIIDGIPLLIKHVNVTITRPQFTFNPTDCEPQQIGGALTSSEGAVESLHVPFQVTNCATLGFKPIFTVSTTAKTSRANGASLHVKLTYPKAPFGTQANIGYVKVDLPKQLPSRLETLKKACPDTTFNEDPAACPPESRVGHATATTPVLPVFLQGPAYFVSHGGAKFPELIIALQGQGVTVYLHGETFIEKGITSSTFHTIPDVPVGTFELSLPEGPYSALAANGNLCQSKLKMPTSFHAANGMQIKQTTSISVTGCAKHKAKSSKRGRRRKHKHRK